MEKFKDPKKTLPEADKNYVVRIPSCSGNPVPCICFAGTPMPLNATGWAYLDSLPEGGGHEDPCGKEGVNGVTVCNKNLRSMTTEGIREKVLTFLSQHQAQNVDCSKEEFGHFVEILTGCVEYVLKGGMYE